MGKRRIVSVFYTTHPDTVGNSNMLMRYKALASEFSLIIFTNQPDFLNDQVFTKDFKVTIYNIPHNKKYLFWFISFLRILTQKFDALYLRFSEAPIALGRKGKPFFCRIDQSHAIIGFPNSNRKNTNYLKKILKKTKVEILLYFIKKANHCFAVSKQLVSFFISKGVNQKRISYLPHGVDFNLFDRHEIAELSKPNEISGFCLLYSGWVAEKRGLNIMLEGIKICANKHSDIKLIIIGATDEYYDSIRNYSILNKIERNLVVLKRIQYEKIPRYLYYSDVCISLLEPILTYSISPPQKIFEYFAMGKPVIANKIPTHTDYIIDGMNGRIIEYEIESFVDAVIQLYENKYMVESMSKTCVEYSKRYTIDNINKILIEKINSKVNRDNN